ncbi:hypothetical protein [Microbacterium sp. AG1240]|uniref:hypothetical protein n=1 Tax=Microbacterium sp. AG1240 TaxID=2183992 RepID=UPI0011C44D8E|nr:hypothetical protein [Microbacterium sp. AG1240]
MTVESSARTLVLLTAAITPKAAGPVAVVDPKVRLSQYRSALESWIRDTPPEVHLVILETTGCFTDELRESIPIDARERVVVTVIPASPEAERRGKGSAEFEVVERYLSGLRGKYQTIYKVTGRLALEDAARLVVPLRDEEVRARAALDRSYVDTRLVGAGRSAWQFLLEDMVADIDDMRGVYVEHVLAARIATGLALRQISMSRFPWKPVFLGVSGTTGGIYGGNKFRRLIAVPQRYVESKLAALAQRKQV